MLNTNDEKQLQQEFFDHDAAVPPQEQDRQPGLRGDTKPKPDCGEERYQGTGKLTG